MIGSRRGFLLRGGAFGGLVAATALRVDGRASAHLAEGGPPPAASMESWWVDLEKGEPDSTRALLKLSGHPAETTAFLEGRMKPLQLDADRLQAILVSLGSAKEEDWKPAFEELEYYDPRLAIDLETLMADVVDAPARQRMVAVMSGRPGDSLDGKNVMIRAIGGRGADGGFNFFSENGSWWAEHRVARINAFTWAGDKKKWTRAVRAVALLEHFGTPDALAILKGMATGHPEAQPTREAVAALGRIAKEAR